MDKTGKRCVLYSRVSTEMQVDGFSLAGQKTCLTRYVEREELKVVGEYEDAGKSGKSIEGRPAFKRMIDDIKSGLKVDYVIVYKLSRFGRNAADVLNSLELIQDYGVNLICTDEGIDSSQASGRLLISVLSAVAQIERENILEQTMNGRREKARQGLWNGGQAPYGYRLDNGKLVISPEEAEVVKLIYDKYVNSTASLAEIARYLNNQGILKEEYGNRKKDTWGPSSIGKVISNPVYAGKISWGHRQNTKVKGQKEMKRVYTKENIIVSNGQHELIVSEELYNKAQEKREKVREYYKSYIPKTGVHILTKILKCPVCGGNMTSYISKRDHVDGTQARTNYYICSHASKGKCTHFRAYLAEACEQLVINGVAKLVNNDYFINSLEEDLHFEKAKNNYEAELANYNKTLKNLNSSRSSLENEIDFLDSDDPNYEKTRENLNSRLYKVYDKIYEIEEEIDKTKKKIEISKKDFVSANLVVKSMKNFVKTYDILSPMDKKVLLNSLISRIEIYPRELNEYEYSLRSITFKFNIFSTSEFKNEEMENLNKATDNTNVMYKTIEFTDENNLKIDSITAVPIVYASPIKRERVNQPKEKHESYKRNDKIREFVKEKYNILVYGQLIRRVKDSLGIEYRRMYGKDKKEETAISIEKWDAIVDALVSLKLIPFKFADNIDEIIKEARVKMISNNKFKRDLRKDRFTYKEITEEVKKETGYIIYADNIKQIIDIIENYDNYRERRVFHLPKIERAKALLDCLIKHEYINDKDAYLKLQSIYDFNNRIVVRKKKYNNEDIIDYVKINNHINVNPSMISYVRDKLGICLKTKDRRYDPLQKNKRVPNDTQFNAIVYAMKQFNMI